MTVRQGDAPSTQDGYRQKRWVQSIFGGFIALAGIALLVWFPGTELVRIAVGGAVLLLGGMITDPNAVREWLSLVTEFVPLLRGGKK